MYQNKVTLIGFLGSNAEARTANNGSFTAGNQVLLQEGRQVHLAHRMAPLRRLRQALGVRQDAHQGRTCPGGRRTAQPGKYETKKTDTKQRIWEIRVASILKLDRAEKAAPEDQEHDETPQEETAA
jgi:single-strand DNA-binding protein